MFKQYERAVVALSNYSRFYGLDSEDELVLKEYIRQCDIEKNKPHASVLSVLGGCGEDNTRYMLPLLRTEIEVQTSIKTKLQAIEDVIKNLPELFSDYIDNEWEVVDEEFDFKPVENETFFVRYFNKIKKRLGLSRSVSITAKIKLSKRLFLTSDEDGDHFIRNAFEMHGFVPISKEWKLLDQRCLSNISDIEIKVVG